MRLGSATRRRIPAGRVGASPRSLWKGPGGGASPGRAQVVDHDVSRVVEPVGPDPLELVRYVRGEQLVAYTCAGTLPEEVAGQIVEAPQPSIENDVPEPVVAQ